VPGTAYDARVYAKNRAQVSSDADWARSAAARGTAFGTPGATSPLPDARARANGDVQITWGPAAPNGDGTLTYSVFRSDGDQVTSCDRSKTSIPLTGASSALDQNAGRGSTYRYFVYADNGYFCTVSSTGSVDSLPGKANGALGVSQRSPSSNQWDVTVTSLGVDGRVTGVTYEASTAGGPWTPVQVGSFLSSRATPELYGTDVSVRFRACKANNCSDQVSDPVSAKPIQTQGSINSCIASSATQRNALGITAPDNNQGEGTTPSYRVQYLRPTLLNGLFESYVWVDGPQDDIPDDSKQARIKVTVASFTSDWIGMTENCENFVAPPQ
jgi:hypothetical protein